MSWAIGCDICTERSKGQPEGLFSKSLIQSQLLCIFFCITWLDYLRISLLIVDFFYYWKVLLKLEFFINISE